MFLTPMRQKAVVGSLTRLSQAFQFFPRQLEIAYELPLKPSLSSCVKTDRDLVHADQLITFLAVHDRLHGKVTAKGCAITKYYPQAGGAGEGHAV